MQFRDVALTSFTCLTFTSGLAAQASYAVDARPVIDIRGTSDRGDVAFNSANWATRRLDGGVVIADGGLPGLRFFDHRGALVRAVGRDGQGPGEFRSVTWTGHCGGLVYAFDWIQRRLTGFDSTGAMRHSSVVSATPQPFTVTCARDGAFAFLGVPAQRDMSRGAAGSSASVVTGGSPFVLSDSSGIPARTLGSFAIGELVAGAGVEGTRPLGRWTTFAIATDRVYVGTGEAAEVVVFDRSGKTLPSIQVPVVPRAPTPAQQAAAINDLALMVPARFRQQAKAQMANVPLPERLPPYRAVLADPDGMLWVVVSESGDRTSRLLMFGANGRVAAEVVIPVGLRVFEVGRDFVLGAKEDADGEQHVQVWRYHRR